MDVLQRYPALNISLYVCMGIVLAWKIGGDVFHISLSIALLLSMVAAAVSMVAQSGLFSLIPLLRTMCIMGACVAASAAMYSADTQLPEDHVAFVVANTHRVSEQLGVTAHGRIIEMPHETELQFRVVISLDSLLVDGDSNRINGRVQVVRWMRDGASLQPMKKGDVIMVRGNVSPTPRPRNPADMNYGAYLQRRGIFAQIEVDDVNDLNVIGERPGWSDSVIGPVRHHVNQQINRHLLHEEARGVLRALLLGDRSGIDADRREQFVRTGLMHLLAVSGLHVLLVGFVLYQLLQPFLLRFRLSWKMTEVTRAALTMAVLLLYMLLTETRPSVVRATVMAGLFIGSSVLQRPSNSLNTLGVAAIILLIMRPTQLFDVGFQLSFAAVGAILLLNPLLQRWMTGDQDVWWAYFAAIGTTTIAATVGTLPVLLAHFGFASFAGLLLNLFAIPATALGLAGGLLMLVSAIWWPTLAGILGLASDVFLRGLIGIAATGMEWLSWASIEMTLDIWSGTVLVGAIGAVVSWTRPRVRWTFGMLMAGVVTLSVWADVADSNLNLDVIFLDVGQANAALVKLPDGGHALFDTGRFNPLVDSGERTILPHLRHFGIDRLRAVVISHPHSDHLGGLASVLEAIPVDTVYRNGDVLDTAVYERVGVLLDSLPVQERIVRQGEMISLSPSVHAKVLAPSEETLARDNVNDASLVVRLTYGQTSFLFLGDAEEQAEKAMGESFEEFLSADVIQVGHHGSTTSSSQPFVEKALSNASVDVHAVISAGARNLYGHPAEPVLASWRYNSTHVHWTAVNGAVWFRSDGINTTHVGWR